MMNSKKTYSELFLYVTGVTETRSKVCLGILTDRDCHAFNTLLTSKGREIQLCSSCSNWFWAAFYRSDNKAVFLIFATICVEIRRGVVDTHTMFKLI